MGDKEWIMNCVLAGAKAYQLFCLLRHEELKVLLKNLTSELNDEDVAYLIMRIEGIYTSGN